MVPLGEQDRAGWGRALIAEGHDLVRECLATNRPGRHQLLAAINAVRSRSRCSTIIPSVVTAAAPRDGRLDMAHLLYFEFPSTGPYGPEAAAAYADLAADIADQDGLVWKVWTENPETATAGGVYLFTDADAAARYVEKHTARLAGFGITDIEVRSVGVNEDLSRVTHAALTPPS